MKVLITGATGFLGSRLVEHLTGDDRITFILATGRKFSHNNKVSHEKVKYTLGDLQNAAFVKELFTQDIDVVINCASLSSPWGRKEQFHRANIITQQNLLYESKKANIKRFLYISSPSIYFNFKDSLDITEDTPLPQNMVNEYARTKWAAECLTRDSELPYVILRPRALIGRGDTVIMPRLIRSCLEGRLKIMGDGENVVDLTSVANMCEAIRLALYTDYVNESYNISNGEPVKLWTSINQVLQAIDMDPIHKKIPYFVLYSIAYLMELKARLFRGAEPVLTRYSVGTLSKSFTFDISKSKEKLKYQPHQSTQEAIDEFAQWYKSS